MSKSERTKVVVRNLPPTLALDAFKSVLDKHMPEDSYNWLQYYPGKISTKRTVFSRAFINFNTAQDVLEFKARFEGHVFVSARGAQYRCSVEYAPFQKVPAKRTKKLAMEGTIEKDPDYQAFIQALEEGPKAQPTAQAVLEAQEAARAAEEAKGPVVTALMAFLQKKYEAGASMTGRRGARGPRGSSRRDIGSKLAAVEEDDGTADKSAKSRSSKGSGSISGSKSSRADAAAAAAAAAVAAGAATQALKGSRPKSSKDAKQHGQPQEGGHDQHQPGSKKLVVKKSSDASKARQNPASSGSKHGRHAERGAAAAAKAAPEADPSSRRTSKTKPGAEKAEVAVEDEEARAAAAAAMAAASAANAAAAAARKPRVKAGHQVYTPGAGGRLFAAALPKSSAGSASKSAGEGPDTAATAGDRATTSAAARKRAPAQASSSSRQPAASQSSEPASTANASAVADAGSKDKRTGTGHGSASRGKASGGRASGVDAALTSTGDGGAATVTSTAAALSKLAVESSADQGSQAEQAASRGSKPGKGGGSRGARGGHSSKQQHQWVPKPSDAS